MLYVNQIGTASMFTLDCGFKVWGVQGIDSSQWALILPSDRFIGVQFPCSHCPRLRWMLEVQMSQGAHFNDQSLRYGEKLWHWDVRQKKRCRTPIIRICNVSLLSRCDKPPHLSLRYDRGDETEIARYDTRGAAGSWVWGLKNRPAPGGYSRLPLKA